MGAAISEAAGQLQFTLDIEQVRPFVEVIFVQSSLLDLKDLSNIGELPVSATLFHPQQLGKNGVLRGDHGAIEIEHSDLLTSFDQATVVRAGRQEPEVNFVARASIQYVEHPALPIRVVGGFRVHVVRGLWEASQQRIKHLNLSA